MITHIGRLIYVSFQRQDISALNIHFVLSTCFGTWTVIYTYFTNMDERRLSSPLKCGSSMSVHVRPCSSMSIGRGEVDEHIWGGRETWTSMH